MGADYLNPGQIHYEDVASWLAGSIAPGNKKCVETKWEGNEDALAALMSQSGLLLLLGDSHFGRFAAEQGMALFSDILKQASGAPERKLFLATLALDQEIRRAKVGQQPPIHPSCATTFIAVWIQDDTFAWSSVGDSRLWHIRAGEVFGLNDLSHQFLGDVHHLLFPLLEFAEEWQWPVDEHNVLDREELWWLLSKLNRYLRGLPSPGFQLDSVQESLTQLLPDSTDFEALFKIAWHPFHMQAKSCLPEWGTGKLRTKDRLVLISDGMEPSASGVSTEELMDLASSNHGPPLEILKKIMSACMGRRGGGDNLSAWLFEYPPEGWSDK